MSAAAGFQKVAQIGHTAKHHKWLKACFACCASVRPRPRGFDLDDHSDEEDDDLDAGEILQTVPGDFQRHFGDSEDSNPMNIHNLQVPQYLTVPSDDRPITPLRDKMVYDLRYSSLDFKDGNSQLITNTHLVLGLYSFTLHILMYISFTVAK